MINFKHIRVILLLLLLMVCGSQAKDITVQPGQSIQASINASNPGDIIEVQRGTYYENLNVSKQLTLRGVGYPVIDAGHNGSAIVLIADGIVLEGFTVTNASWMGNFIGVGVKGSSCTLISNKALNNDDGIALEGSNNSTLENNTAIGNIIGILLAKANDNQISGNNITNSDGTLDQLSGGIVLIYSKNNSIAGNAAEDPYNGIYLRYSDGNRLDRNLAASMNGNCISVLDSSNNQIEDNNASYGYLNGIYLDNSSNSSVERNMAQENYNYGLMLKSSRSNLIRNNSAINNKWDGIDLTDSGSNTLDENNAGENSGYGISLFNSSNNTLARNDASGNELDGIYVYYSVNNLIKGNFDRSNRKGSIEIVNFSFGRGDNTIFQNYFVDNNRPVYDDGINTWDNGSLGNYYSDFACHDRGDGICDSSYAILGGRNVDRFPLATAEKTWLEGQLPQTGSAAAPTQSGQKTMDGSVEAAGGTQSGSAANGALTSIPAQNCDWSGTWNTDFGTMVLQQSGETVTETAGTHLVQGGQIQGNVSDNKLIGNWNQTGSAGGYFAGSFEFKISNGCNSFSGNYWNGFDTSVTPSGGWNGNRLGGPLDAAGGMQSNTAAETQSGSAVAGAGVQNDCEGFCVQRIGSIWDGNSTPPNCVCDCYLPYHSDGRGGCVATGPTGT